MSNNYFKLVKFSDINELLFCSPRSRRRQLVFQQQWRQSHWAGFQKANIALIIQSFCVLAVQQLPSQHLFYRVKNIFVMFYSDCFSVNMKCAYVSQCYLRYKSQQSTICLKQTDGSWMPFALFRLKIRITVTKLDQKKNLGIDFPGYLSFPRCLICGKTAVLKFAPSVYYC